MPGGARGLSQVGTSGIEIYREWRAIGQVEAILAIGAKTLFQPRRRGIAGKWSCLGQQIDRGRDRMEGLQGYLARMESE